MIGPILGGYARAKFDNASYAICWDGNSISDAAFSDLVTRTATLPPLNNQLVITNKAINGQSVQQMTANRADVNSAFVPGKINYLIVFEITNNVYNDGRTGLETCADLVAYINAVKAVNPWRVILVTGLPRGSLFGSRWDVVTGEQQMQAANAYIRANWRQMGAVAMVEARRPGGPFDFTDCADAANFPASLWTDRTHPSNGASGGKAILAGYIADVLKRLPAR